MSNKFKEYMITLEMADGKVHRMPFAVPLPEKGDAPVKGVDYWTEDDKKEIIEQVKAGTIGDIATALDSVLAIQNTLIGGGV